MKMASQVTFIRGLNSIRCSRLCFFKSSWRNCDFLGNQSRLFLTNICLENNSNSSKGTRKEAPPSGQRDDLERLKQLLYRNTSTNDDPNTEQFEQKKAKTEEPTKRPAGLVNVNKFKDILSSLTLKPDTHLSFSKKHDESKAKKSTITVVSAEEIVQKEKQETLKSVAREKKITPAVDAGKMRDALSVLGQDRSSSPTEDVLLAGRRQQLAPESLSAMEGVLTIKQRQIRDKDNKKNMQRNSLRTGLRLHWFDHVKTEWSDSVSSSAPTLFQEMAEKEVRDMGTSVGAHSGFQDLIENIDRQWSFPVDNETCKNAEENVGFDQHVFLEHIVNEFPTSGNIRQFMELVTTGLQQNPNLSVTEKKEHILWFKEYFENMPGELVQL